jgi:AraC family transcriptional regulator
MAKRMRSVVPLLDGCAPRRIIAVADETSAGMAQALDWPGVLLETGRNDVAEVDDLTLAHHYMGLNADPMPITLEVKEASGYRAVTLAPGTGWLAPAGEPFSLRVRGGGTHAYVRLSIDPARFDRLVNAADATRAVALRRAFGLGGPQIHHLVGALVAEASSRTPSGIAFVETVTAALGLQLLRQAGETTHAPVPRVGGLAPGVRRRVLERMHADASARLSIDELAREAGLSPAHFARAFKHSVGLAPHQHLMMLRLERARRLLEAASPILSSVALEAGFADQAHFTRAFKRQFGVTPGALVRARTRSHV